MRVLGGWVLAVVLGAQVASAASLGGSPQYTRSPPGPVLAFEAGRFGVKAEAGDGPGTLVVIDATDPVVADQVLGQVRLELGGSATAVTQRALAFEPAGWRETVQVDGAAAAMEVVPVAEGVFGLFVQAPAAQSVSVRVTLPDARAGSARVADGIPLLAAAGHALALSGDGEGTASSTELVRTVPAPVPASVGFLVAVAPTEAAAQVAATDALIAHPEAAAWLQDRRSAAAAELAQWTPVHRSSPARDALNAAAIAQLRANLTAQGALAHKSHQNLYWLWPSTFQALALAERSGDDALAAMELHLRSRVIDAASEDRGLLFGRVDATGASPSLNAPQATEFFTQLAPLGLLLRALQDRAGMEPERLRPLYEAGVDYVDWMARRRDRDGDLRYELNGGIEHPQPESPRFRSFWRAEEERYLPVPQSSARAPLDAVDANAWTGHLAIEVSRLGQLLGAPETARMRERGASVAGRIEEESEGFWHKARLAWLDYVREGEELTRHFGDEVRTPAAWSPLAAAMARDPVHLREVVEKNVLDPVFRTPRGIARTTLGTGPISVADTWLTVQGLYRYGYEAEAAALSDALLELLSGSPNLHDEYALDGTPLGPGGSGAAAAIAILALRDWHQEEAFALQNGEVAAIRSGRLRRLFRLNDGRVLMEVEVEGTRALPLTSLRAEHQLFSEEPMTLTFADPDGLLEERTITVRLPILEEAEVKMRTADGRVEERRVIASEDGEPPSFTVHAGDEAELQIIRFAGERGGCGCSSAGQGWVAVALLGLAGLRRRFSRATGA